MTDYQMMRTGAGYKLVLVVQSDDIYIWLHKWRAASWCWTKRQRVPAADVFRPDERTPDALAWFERTKRKASKVQL